MKYKLAFVKDIKEFRENFFYKEELAVLMLHHDMLDLYNEKIRDHRTYRWSPQEIFAVLEGREK